MLKNRNWFPHNTEVYTSQGWVNIENLLEREYVLIGYKDDIIPTKLLELNRFLYQGEIQSYYNNQSYIEGLYKQDKINRYKQELPLPKVRNISYNGYLYNIVTSCNNFIMRNFKKYNYNDYNIVQCTVK